MQRIINRFAGAAIAVTAAMLVMLCGADTATAQICGATQVTIINNARCDVIICLDGVPPIPCSPLVPAGATVPLPVPPGTDIRGVISAGGFFYAWMPNPLPPPQYWVPNVAVDLMNCCVNIFYDPATCTIQVFPAGFPPPCRP